VEAELAQRVVRLLLFPVQQAGQAWQEQSFSEMQPVKSSTLSPEPGLVFL
jgi:hypothetical protein